MHDNAIFFPVWMKIFKYIGDSVKEQSQKDISKNSGASKTMIVYSLDELERLRLISRNRKGDIVYISLTSRGRILWKTFVELELQLGKKIY